jgi:hypothetical protein
MLSNTAARGVGSSSQYNFAPILKMSATVEFTVNPVDNQSSVLFFVTPKVFCKIVNIQWPNYPEGSIPVKFL